MAGVGTDSVTMAADERDRVRQADPRPGPPGELDPSTNTLKRDGKLILDESDSYGVEMALQLVATAGDGEVSIDLDGAERRDVGLRTALAMGAAKGVLVSDPELGRVRRADAPPRSWPPPCSASAAPIS